MNPDPPRADPVAIFDAALDCIISMDREGRVVTFNRAAEETFGYARGNVIGRDVGELIVPAKYREFHQLGYQRYVRTGAANIIGERIRMTAMRSDGSEFSCELTVTVSSTEPELIFTAFIRDVTEQESAEEALRQSQRTVMTLMSNLPGMAYRCPEDEYGNMQFISEGSLELTGYEPDELLHEEGPVYPDLIHPEDRDEAIAQVRASLSKQAPFQVLYRIRTKEGAEKWVLERGRGVSSVFSATGALIAIEGFITDITERKKAEELLSEYSQRLQAEVAARTTEVNARNRELKATLKELRRTHDQLIMQEKMASLGALTAGIAHEIKNPLNFVNNFAQLSVELIGELDELMPKLKNGVDTAALEELEEIAEHLATNATKILEHGKRADSIMRSMLLHSRGTSGERQKTDINALVEEDLNLAYHGMRAQDKTFNVTFEKDFDPNAGTAEIIPQDVARVFLNIVNNACHAVNRRRQTEDGQYVPLIRVTTKGDPKNVTIKIWDNGPGIPKNVRAKIFDPFFTTKAAGEGTGLGLSISYETIVQKHGGQLDVHSEPDAFTEFIITLPRESQREPA